MQEIKNNVTDMKSAFDRVYELNGHGRGKTFWFRDCCCSVTQSCPTLATPWTAARQASLSITNSQSLPKLVSIESVMPSNHLILCCPLLHLPASGSFSVSQFFILVGQKLGVSVSASVLPMNIQDQFPLGLTGLIFLQSKGFSRVFSNTTVQRHQFFGAQPSL